MNNVVEADFLPRETNGVDTKADLHTDILFLRSPSAFPS
jgi:hypothetical protein